jgi:peptidoglycan/LPS O-acetylase OafA/YrhL
MARLHTLDYLRGIAATGIMVYHLLTWWYGAFPHDSVMARIGVYGVSIFYILSGLTLFHVYGSKITDHRSVGDFWVRRVFRIFPLMWVVTLLAIWVTGEQVDARKLLLTLTGAFGFAAPTEYVSPGMWSIGNELVFYVLFPALVLFARTHRGLLVLAGFALFVPYLHTALVSIDPETPLGAADQWAAYVNPFNQAFLFFGGVAIAYTLRTVRISQAVAWTGLICSIAGFVTLPIGGDPSASVAGWTRLGFTVLCLAMAASAYKISADVPRFMRWPLRTIGEASYSVYLLHPITYWVVRTYTPDWGRGLSVMVTLALTMAVAWACYAFIEKPLNELGRKVTTKRTVTSPVTP